MKIKILPRHEIIRHITSLLSVFLICQSVLYAGTTGKLAGRIIDKDTREPLPFVNVLIEGTSMGAATDIDGYYVILNIPPGTYSVRAQYVGYQTVVIENVTVSVDLTSERDFELSSTTVELETLVVTAERLLIIKDMTSSLSSITAEQIENLPVQTVQQVLRLNAGIIEDNGRLSIRGGRTSEVAYWVNGISTTDVFNGTNGLTVENSAVQELQVISGTFNAEYGQAMSGIVNIITKEGGKEYTGQIKVYGGDYVSSADEFGLYKSIVTEADPVTGRTRVVEGERERPLEKYNPIYNGEFSLSGPIPLTGDNLTFFTTGRYFKDEGYYYGREWYKPSGVPGNNELVALNPLERFSGQGKLSYRLSNAIRLSYDIFWSKTTRDKNYFGGTINSATGQQTLNTHDYKYNPNGLPQNFNEAFTHLFTLNHVLSASSFYELRVSRYNSETKQYVYENPLASVNYLVSIQEDTAAGIIAETFDASTPEGQAKLQDIIARGGIYEYVPDPNGPEGYIKSNTDGTFSAPASYSFLNRGMDMNHTNRSTSYWTAKLDFTSQVNKTNQIRAGVEARLHEIEYHNFRIVPAIDASGQEITPFQPSIPEIGNINRDDYIRKPREFSAYLQDKIEFERIILNVGLRFDYFDANTVVPTDPTDPNIYLPFKYGHIYAGVPENISELIGGHSQFIAEQLAAGNIREYTPDERRAFMHKKVDAKTSISPRLGIAFPITDRGVIHFSYGHFFQIPEFQYLYLNPDFKLSASASNALFGNPDLEPQKTVMYELGLQQQLTEDIGIDVTLFYRDVRDWVGTSALINSAKVDVEYSQYENKDYENVKGITLKIEKRFSNNYSFRTDYTFQSAEGTYSSPTDYYNSIANNRSPVLALVPMGWDQKHTLNAQIIYELEDWTFSLIGRYWSGQPYTPQFPRGAVVTEVSGLSTNSARLPAQKSVDLTINKLFRLFSNVRLELFLNVYNLFDQIDETNVYQDTGTAEYTTTINPLIIPYDSGRLTTVEDYVLQPGWYTGPRQVQFGVILGF
jgi:hypothetical protein